MTHPIEHTATVIRVGEGVVETELAVQSACAACHARAVCGTGDAGRRRITVATEEARSFAVGEQVVVSVERKTGMTAVLWAYVAPFAILLGVLAAASLAGWGDGAAVAASLGSVVLYYLALYFSRGLLEKKIQFKIHKQ